VRSLEEVCAATPVPLIPMSPPMEWMCHRARLPHPQERYPALLSLQQEILPQHGTGVAKWQRFQMHCHLSSVGLPDVLTLPCRQNEKLLQNVFSPPYKKIGRSPLI